MGIKKTITLLAIIASTQLSFGQNVKIKKTIVTIDKVELCKVVKDNLNIASFNIQDLQNEPKLFFKWVKWGQFGYYEVYRTNDYDNILFETDVATGYKKWIIKKLYNAKVLTSSGIDEDKLIEFSKKIGKEYSRRRSQY